jgi:hypothetical protein
VSDLTALILVLVFGVLGGGYALLLYRAERRK